MVNITMVNRFLKTLPKNDYTLEELVSELKSNDFRKRGEKVEDILNFILTEFNITQEDIESKYLKFAKARQLYFFLCNRYTIATHKFICDKINKTNGVTTYNKSRVQRYIDNGDQKVIGILNRFENIYRY